MENRKLNYEGVMDAFLEWVEVLERIPENSLTLTVNRDAIKDEWKLPDIYEAEVDITWSYMETLDHQMYASFPHNINDMNGDNVDIDTMCLVSESGTIDTSIEEIRPNKQSLITDYF